MLPHQQYVLPFAPMNALGKLLDGEGYDQFVSVDTILSRLLPPTDRLIPLDAGVANMDYDVCRSLAELGTRLAGRSTERPAFAFTLPQNVHIATITRAGAEAIDGESYAGFYAPYASRVRRLDGCIGAFIDSLRAAGLYDRSVVVLTSDHGDSLGEEGRWGHAYTLFPEIVRVPLIVHLPPGLAARWTADPAAPAFLTDLAPTLYALLGHPPAFAEFPRGRSLVRRRGSPPQAVPSEWLVASSYGAVYGVVSDAGRHLYVVDGINVEDHAFNLAEGPVGARVPVTASMRATNRRIIRDRIGDIAAFYGVPPQSQ